MGRYNELPVYKASYDLLLEIFRFTKNISKEFKYTVGESLKKETTKLITLIYRANSKKDKYDVIQEARERIEIIRLFIRLMKDLKQISIKRFVLVNKQIENVSKQLTGWQKKNQIMLIDIERLFLHCFARVAYCYGISKRAVLNPAALLHILRGIIFIFSENGCMISSVVAFTGLPGGYRNNNNGNYNNMGNNGYFWSSTENNNNNA